MLVSKKPSLFPKGGKNGIFSLPLVLHEGHLQVDQLRGKRVGVYIGAYNPDYKELIDRKNYEIPLHYLTGIGDPLIANRISYTFNFTRPSFVVDRLSNGKEIRMLTVIDEYTRKCLSIRVNYQLTSDDGLDVISILFLTEGIPEYIRSDIGSEFTAKILQDWLKSLSMKTAYIEPRSPWENGFNERFNGNLRDKCLNLEYYHTLREARMIIGQWVNEYNHIRPLSGLGYRLPTLHVRVGNNHRKLPHTTKHILDPLA